MFNTTDTVELCEEIAKLQQEKMEHE